MKRLILFSFVLFATYSLCMAQTVVFSDNFDSYTAGSHLAQSNSAWTTWNNAPGSAEDGVISNAQAASAPNSLFISGSVDQIYPFANYASGHYTISFDMYVPSSGNGAYFNLQHSMFQVWAFGCYFNNDGTGYLKAGNIQTDFTYPSNAWFPLVIDVDIDQDSAKLFINNIEVNTWPFHYSELNTNGSMKLAALDLYAGSPDPDLSGTYYIDNFSVSEVSAAMVGQFEVSPGSLQTTMNSNDSITLNLLCTNPGTDIIRYRIVPTYDIPNPDMTSTGGTVLRYCSDTFLSRWGYIGACQYDIAVGFMADSIQSHIGKTLNSISVMMTDEITNAKVRVYGMSIRGPGAVLYEQPFVPVFGWNNVTLDTTFVIDGSDLWVGVWIDQPDSVYPVFYDAYPNNDYSDWFTANTGTGGWYGYSTMYPHNHMIMAHIDGTPIKPWLNVNPENGVLIPAYLMPDADSATVDITVNTFGMGNGENHSAKIHCLSTSYYTPEVVVPVYLSTSVSVNEHNEIEVALYPNPATNFMQITSEEILRVEIYSLSGQRLFDNKYSDSRVTIPTTNLSAGTYIVNVTTTSGKTSKKVVVQ